MTLTKTAVSSESAFERLSAGALAAYSRLRQAIYIYCFDTQRICWANKSALEFWNAEDEAELKTRELTPYNHATESRLAEYRRAFARGEKKFEAWTFYPKGKATAAMCNCSGVSLDGHSAAMLVEIDSPLHFPLPALELRALEAMRLTSLMISLFAPDGRVLMRNPAAAERFEELDAALGKDADHFRAMFADVSIPDQVLADASRQFVVWQTATMTVAGNPVHRIQISIVRDPATGQPAYLVAQEDISDFVHASTQLVASIEALEIVLALDLNPALIVRIRDGNILRINNAAEQLFGPIERLPRHAASLFVEVGAFDRLLAKLQTRLNTVSQAEFLTTEGIGFRAAVRSARLTYYESDAIILSIADITELHRVNAVLEAELNSERAMNEVRSRLLAIAAHDLRTPLAIIDSSAQFLARRANAIEPTILAKRANQIRAAVRSLTKLFDQTIERARDRRGLTFARTKHDLVSMIMEIAATYRELLPGLDLELDLPETAEVALDRVMIEQVLGNLLTNAIKFSIGEPRVRISVEETGDAVNIHVRDWGIGIPQAERDSIFAEFQRGSNVGEVKGSGLGLALVKHAVELHHGSVSLLETGSTGSTFKISLPRN